MFKTKLETMTKKLEDSERVRKAYAPRGERGQKMLNFRCDLENWEFLQGIPNKGRFLNLLIERARSEK